MTSLCSATRKQASAYALLGLKYRPTSARGSSWSITRLTMSKYLARQSATFCRSVCVTKCGYADGDCFPPARERSDIGGVTRTFILYPFRMVLSHHRRGDSRIVPQTNAPHRPYGYRRCNINCCRGDHWSSENKRPSSYYTATGNIPFSPCLSLTA